jgi:hypothetical protein
MPKGFSRTPPRSLQHYQEGKNSPRQEKLDNPMSEVLQSMIDQIRPQGKHPEFPMAPLNPNNHIHSHTLAQKHLIELLMWNASHVQIHFS